MFKDWLYLLGDIEDDNYSSENIVCPECGEKGIDYVFIGDSKTNIGYLSLWCNHCNKGINISRVMIPDKAKRMEFDDTEWIKNNIPNFEQIYPNDW